ncbi:MAG: DnaD domain protein [Clostridiales bacterium]|nr:DnaD domain protein [Clostridiales bacterium]MBQ3322662.1 DnaD domain protein [Bacillota bacterium]
MSFYRDKTKDYFLLDTKVENMFINEYMVSAPGEYVKVYLFALMYAELEVDFSNEDIAKQLSMDIEDVLKAWTYWEKMGIIKKVRKSADNPLDYDVVFVLLKDMLYGSHEETRIVSSDHGINAQMANQEYRAMFDRIEKSFGRVISGTEMSEVLSWINDFEIEPEFVAFAVEYCARKKKKTVKYVEAVIRNWISEGHRTVEDIQQHIGHMEERSADYRRIFRALGWSRNWTEEEKRIMDAWFDKMGFSIDAILDACSKTTGISNPNINYINKVLTSWFEEGGKKAAAGEVSGADINRYYELLRAKEEREAAQRREEVYSRLPQIKEIDEEESRLGASLSRILVSDRVDKKEAIEQIREQIDEMSAQRAFLMTDNGFELDYMDIKYECPDCKDTGKLETGERCPCHREITQQKIEALQKTE